MKKMTKIFAIAGVAVATLFGTKVKAQSTTPANKLRFGIGVEGFVPTGSLSNASKVGIGGTARLQYGVSQNVALMLTSGYYNGFGKKYDVPQTYGDRYPSKGIVPVKAGIKGYVGGAFYLSGEVGAGFETRDIYQNPNGSKNTKLILSPGLGYSFKHIDIGARYENFSGQGDNYGIAALRVAYGFGL